MAVANESSLTGESVPQMKEALGLGKGTGTGGEEGAEEGEGGVCLDMNGLHRVNTLFSGTSLVTVDGGSAATGLGRCTSLLQQNMHVFWS